MIAIQWSNGKVDRARTWEALEAKVRTSQWSELTAEEFRLEMEKRAMRWSKTEIDPWLPADKFFMELERAKMIVILEDNN